MKLFYLVKILSPFIFIGFICLITLLVVKLFVTKKVFRSTLICVGIFYVSLILILCCTDSGKVGYASLYNFIKTTTKLALNTLVIMSANSVQILQGLVNMTLSIFALASFIVLIKQIIIAGPRYMDAYVRLLLADIPEEKIVHKCDILEATSELKLDGIEEIFILHDLYSLKETKQIKQKVKEIIDGESC